jgi:hypothetical protein
VPGDAPADLDHELGVRRVAQLERRAADALAPIPPAGVPEELRGLVRQGEWWTRHNAIKALKQRGAALPEDKPGMTSWGAQFTGSAEYKGKLQLLGQGIIVGHFGF